MDPISILLITFLSLGILTAVGGLIFTAFDFAKPKGGSGDKITSNIRTKASPFKEINKAEDIEPALNGMADYYKQKAAHFFDPFHKEKEIARKVITFIDKLPPNEVQQYITKLKKLTEPKGPNILQNLTKTKTKTKEGPNVI